MSSFCNLLPTASAPCFSWPRHWPGLCGHSSCTNQRQAADHLWSFACFISSRCAFPPAAVQIGLSVLEQPEGPPDGFDELASTPQDWVAIPDDAALFKDLPYEEAGLVAAGPAGEAGEAPAPAPAQDDSGSEEELLAEAEADPAALDDGTDAEQQQAAEEQQRR